MGASRFVPQDEREQVRGEKALASPRTPYLSRRQMVVHSEFALPISNPDLPISKRSPEVPMKYLFRRKNRQTEVALTQFEEENRQRDQ
jgi:hypothetical protein